MGIGSIFKRWISKFGSTRTTRTLNKKTGKFTSTTTSKSQRAAKKKTKSRPRKRK